MCIPINSRRAVRSVPLPSLATDQFNRYVDSASGNDSFDGLTPATAKQTFAGAVAVLSLGMSLGLARGSNWPETLSVPYTGFRSGVYGSGAAPILLGWQTITPGSWVRHDSVTYPNVWSRSLTSEGGGEGTLTAGLDEDGVLLPWRASIAAVESAGASGWFTSTRESATYTAYIYSATDPNSNGKVYRHKYRTTSIKGGPASLAAVRTADVVGPLEADGFRGHYNFSGGPGSQSRLLVRNGSGHHITTCGNLTDAMMVGFDTSYLQSPLAVYLADGRGQRVDLTRVHIPGDSSWQQSGLFAHNTSTATPWDSVNADQCIVQGVTSGVSLASGVSQTITNTAVLDYSASGIICPPCPLTVSRFQCRSANTSGGSRVAVDGSSPNPAVQNVLVEDSVFYWATGNSSGCLRGGPAGSSYTFRRSVIYSDASNFFAFTGANSMSLTVENCIIVVLQAGTRFLSMASGLTYVGSNNLWVGGGNGWNYNGTFYAAANLAGFQSATGQEVGSIRSASATGLFSGNPADGDFRLAGSGLGATATTMGVGPANYWNHNTRSVTSGPPYKWPILPSTLIAQRSWLDNPTAYDWYA